MEGQINPAHCGTAVGHRGKHVRCGITLGFRYPLEICEKISAYVKLLKIIYKHL
jgi:hypothetical protein